MPAIRTRATQSALRPTLFHALHARPNLIPAWAKKRCGKKQCSFPSSSIGQGASRRISVQTPISNTGEPLSLSLGRTGQRSSTRHAHGQGRPWLWATNRAGYAPLTRPPSDSWTGRLRVIEDSFDRTDGSGPRFETSGFLTSCLRVILDTSYPSHALRLPRSCSRSARPKSAPVIAGDVRHNPRRLSDMRWDQLPRSERVEDR